MKTWKPGALSLLVFCSIHLSGCDSLRQEVDPDRLNREAAKLVVACFLSPQDTLLAVKLIRTRTVLNDGSAGSSADNNVTNAIVTLSEGGRTVTLGYDAKGNFYRASVRQLPVVAGRTYALTVQTPDGQRATSTCTVPGPVQPTGITFDSLTENQFGRQIKRYFVRARWLDPAGQADYYLTTGSYRFAVPNAPGKEQLGYLSVGNNNNGGLLTDRNNEGREMISERLFMSGISYSNNGQANYGRYKITNVLVNLFNTNQAYYQYMDAVARQSQVSGNPFAEPVPIPSNIEGALGCFGAYNRSTLTVQLK